MGTLPYPNTSVDRYVNLTKMVALDVDAGFAACSYGRFQILGSNYKACGFTSPMEHALTHAVSEEAQLQAFESFVTSNAKLLQALRTQDWATFARLYNGPSYAANKYDTKLSSAYVAAQKVAQV